MLCAAPASASTIVYQCGAAVCAGDPDAAGAQPRRAHRRGTAGRRDARRRHGVLGRSLRRARQGTGRGRRTRADPFRARSSTSPRCRRTAAAPVVVPGPGRVRRAQRGLGAAAPVGQPESEGVSFCSFCVTTHGWLGTTAVGAFPSDPDRGVASRVCRLASPAEAPEVTGSCVQVLASDGRGGIGFPSGDADGTEIVAVLTPAETTGIRGRIVRYSLTTGGPIGDVTRARTTPRPRSRTRATASSSSAPARSSSRTWPAAPSASSGRAATRSGAARGPSRRACGSRGRCAPARCARAVRPPA